MRAAARQRPTSFDPRVRIALAAFALLIALPIVTWVYCLIAERPVSKVRVAGMEVPRSRPVRTFLEQRADMWSREGVTLHTGVHVWRPSRAELGIGLPVAEAEREIRSLGRSANPMIALRAFWKGNFGSGHDLRWRAQVVDAAALDAYVQRIREAVDRLPVPGSYDPNGQPIDGMAGEALDVEALKLAIRSNIARGATSVTVSTLVTPAPRSFRRFENASTASTASDVLMMAQETDYRPRSGRAINIEQAARALDGKVIMPGDGFSFNAVVGKRDASRGFAAATELVNGEVVEGIGGGVCQVAGTLHAAAFFAGLMVEEYRPHSRLNQFAYLRPGLDTMVAWPESVTDLAQTKDMRLRNPYPFPIRIKTITSAKTPFQNTLRVELYGASRPFRVDWSFEEVGKVPPGEVRRVDPALRPGEERVAQKGLEGIVIMRRRTIYMPTEAVQQETRVAYPPTPTIVSVGPG